MNLKKFRQTVAAERFGSTQWTKRDFFVLLIIPSMFLTIFFLQLIKLDDIWLSVIDTTWRIILFILLGISYQSMLRQHWASFKKAWKRSWVVIIIGAILLQVVTSLSRGLVPEGFQGGELNETTIDVLTMEPKMFALLFFLSIGPIATALIEDIIFRYTLLSKLFKGSWLTKSIIIIVNSIIFGCIHYYNFGSFIGTIPFMFAGLFLNLIYIWTRNIWHVLLIHTVNNSVIAIGGLLVIAFIRLFHLM